MKKRSLGIVLTALAAAFLASKTGSSSIPANLDKETIKRDLPRLVQKLGEYGVDSRLGEVYFINGIKIGDSTFNIGYHPNRWSPGLLWIQDERGRIFCDNYADMTLNGIKIGDKLVPPNKEDRKEYLRICSELLLKLSRN